MVDKNKLREVTVGTQHTFKREIVEWEGQEFEIREPSVYVRGQIMNKSGMGIIKITLILILVMLKLQLLSIALMYQELMIWFSLKKTCLCYNNSLAEVS